MKTLRLKIALIVLIILLFISVSLPYFMSVRIVFAAKDKPNWGDLFTNPQGKSICVCSDTVDDCTPCMVVPD